MASGSITLTKSGSGNIEGRIQWSAVSNGSDANTSTVTATMQLKRPANAWTLGTWKGKLTVGATTQEISYYVKVTETWTTIATLTATVSHNADGTGACYIYGQLNGPGATSMEGTSLSATDTVALDTIARFASIVSAPNFHDEENPVITYANPAGSSVATLEACISLDGSSDDIAYRTLDKAGSNYTFSLTEAERNVLRAATTGSNSRSVKFCIRTVIGSSSGNSSMAKTFTIRNPEPTISPTITDSNSVTKDLTGNSSKLVRYCSNAAVTIGAAAVKQATLKSQKVTCGNRSLTADGTINGVETNSFLFTATDSRGNTTVKTVTAPFVEYIKLTCDLANEIPDAGGSMTVKATGNYFNGSFGAKSNSLWVYYRYKPYGGTYSSWAAMAVTLSGNTYSAAADVTGLDYQTAYVFEAYAADALTTAYSAEKTVKATPVFDWSEQDFKFNVPVTFSGQAVSNVGTFATEAALETALNELFGKMHNNEARSVRFVLSTLGDWTWTGTLFRSSDSYATLHVLSGVEGHVSMITNTLTNGTWTALEWKNPPMQPGVEYRTWERYLGKPVYVKVIDFGALPNNSYKSISHGLTKTAVVSLSAASTNGKYYFPGTSNSQTVELYINASYIMITATGDWSNISAYVTVKYTKD